jgi:hypothetical protein
MSPSRLADLLPLNLPLPAQLEQWRQTLLRQLPAPITGEQTLFVGDPLKVIIAFSADGVDVLLPVQESAMSSVSRHRPQPQGRIHLVDGSYEQLMSLVQATITRRMASFRECACCGRRAPQELLGSLQGQPACRQCLEGRRFLF